MIVDMIRADVLKAPQRHIVFAVNMEGFNDVGFAGQVSSRFWQELASTGPKKLGEVMTHEAGDHTFHAVVCYSLGKGGWQQTPELVTSALNVMDVAKESIAVVLMGAGMVGQMSGADVYANLGALARSNKRIVVYTL